MKKVLIGVGVVVALLVVIGFILPARVHVERNTTINAQADKVFGYINNFREFNKWSPWAKLDPETQYTFSGPESGLGASMSWQSSHPNVGSGSQKITQSEAGKRVAVELNFGDQGIATAYYDLAPEGTATRVSWGFDTDLGINPIARYFGLFFDSMIGADYERGLASLKMLVENS